jgi:dipeptidyl aminopeptidase/acylaminoacyl peptidase
MPETHDVLEQIGDRVPMPEPAFDRLGRRRVIKRRRQRIAAGVVGLLVPVALAVFFVNVGHDRGQVPRLDTTPLPSNGAVIYAVKGSELFLAEGGEAHRIVAPEPGTLRSCPDYSPDGSSLVYGERVAHAGAVVVTPVDPDGAPTGPALRIDARTSERPPCPSWSPDGRKILFRDDDGIWIATLDEGTFTTTLLRDEVAARGFGSAAWSPDSSSIAGWVANGILIIPIDGGEPSFLPAGAPGGDLAWSPDGSMIAGGRGGQDGGVQVIDVDDGGTRLLDTGAPSRGGAPAWSPDGETIAFATKDRAFLVDPDGGPVTELPPVMIPDVSPRPLGIQGVEWSPDGRSLLTVAVVWEPELSYAIVAIPADGVTPASLVSPVTFDLYWTFLGDVDWRGTS